MIYADGTQGDAVKHESFSRWNTASKGSPIKKANIVYYMSEGMKMDREKKGQRNNKHS